MATAKRKHYKACSQDQFKLACDFIAQNHGGINAACEFAEITCPGSFYLALNSNDKNAQLYAHAKELQCTAKYEQLNEIANEPLPTTASGSLDSAAVQDKRLRIDTLKWELSKLIPKKYGEKVDITTQGEKITNEPDINDLSPDAIKKLSDAILAINK